MIEILFILIGVGALLYVLHAAPLDSRIRTRIDVVVILAVLYCLLGVFGLIHGFPHVRLPAHCWISKSPDVTLREWMLECADLVRVDGGN